MRPPVDPVRVDRRALLRRWAADRCYPLLPLTPHEAVPSGWQAWERFLRRSKDELLPYVCDAAAWWDQCRMPWEIL